jgi:hypothetical protein
MSVVTLAHRDFFVLKTTVAAAYRTLQRSKLGESHLGTRSSDYPSSSQGGFVLALQRNIFGAREREKPGLQIIPYSYGTDRGGIFEATKRADMKCKLAAEGRRVKEMKSWNRSHVVTCWQRPLPGVS